MENCEHTNKSFRTTAMTGIGIKSCTDCGEVLGNWNFDDDIEEWRGSYAREYAAKLESYKNETVSRATLRIRDLAPAFHAALVDLDAKEAHKLALEYADVVGKLESGEDMESSEDAYHYINDLIDQLNMAAPEGFYFGAHPGDGSDFGFWEEEEY